MNRGGRGVFCCLHKLRTMPRPPLSPAQTHRRHAKITNYGCSTRGEPAIAITRVAQEAIGRLPADRTPSASSRNANGSEKQTCACAFRSLTKPPLDHKDSVKLSETGHRRGIREGRMLQTNL